MGVLYSFLIILIIVTALPAQNSHVLQRAADLIHQNELKQAEEILLPFESEKNSQTMYLMGLLSIRKNQIDQAKKYLELAVELAPDSTRFHEMLGNAYGLDLQNSNPLSAAMLLPKMVAEWQKAVDLAPERLTPRIALFMYYLRSPSAAGGDHDQALDEARRIADIDSLTGARMLSYFFEESGEYKPAENWIKRALALNSVQEQVLTHAGYFYLRNGQEESGRRYFDRALELYPHSANAFDSKGDYYYTIGVYDSALIFYDLAIRKDKRFEAGWYHKAKALENLQRRSEALQLYNYLVEHFPGGQFAKRARQKLSTDK